MKWKKFTLKTTTEAVDYISSLFDEIGIQGIEIEDNVPLTESETKGMFIDILPELPPDDGTARVSFYLDDDDDAEAILKEVDEGLSELRQYVEIGEGTITASETEDKDWINNWKQYFKPFTVDDILIKPTWETIPEEHRDKLLVQIDPGTAFGTGMHETTQLCIRQLKKAVEASGRGHGQRHPGYYRPEAGREGGMGHGSGRERHYGSGREPGSQRHFRRALPRVAGKYPE